MALECPDPTPDSTAFSREDPAQRRSQPRFRWPFVYGAGDYGAVYDISAGGACLAVSTSLAVGGCYTLALTNGWSGERQELCGRVLWFRKGRAGLEWIDLDAGRRAWLERCCADSEREGRSAVLNAPVSFQVVRGE